MVKIGYSGKMKSFRIRVASGVINHWNKEDIRDVDEKDAESLLKNKDFYLAEETKPKKENKKKEEKTPEIVSGSTIAPVEENKDFKLEEADKDELLDYTAINGIDADYSMTIKELKEAIKKHEDGE